MLQIIRRVRKGSGSLAPAACRCALVLSAGRCTRSLTQSACFLPLVDRVQAAPVPKGRGTWLLFEFLTFGGKARGDLGINVPINFYLRRELYLRKRTSGVSKILARLA